MDGYVIDLSQMDFGLEGLDLSYLELQSDIVKATESMETLFIGLSKLNAKELAKPVYKESIKRRLEDISAITSVSVESLVSDVEYIYGGREYSTEGFFSAIGDMIKKIIKWVADVVKGFFNRIGKIFSSGTVRKSQVKANTARMKSAEVQASKSPDKVLPTTIVCTLPGLTLMSCHHKGFKPKPGFKFNGNTLTTHIRAAQEDIKLACTKLTADTSIYLGVLEGAASMRPEGMVSDLNQISTKLGSARNLRGLYNDKFSAAGFAIDVKPTGSTTGFHADMFGIKSADDLISQWRTGEMELTLELKDYLPGLEAFNSRMEGLDTAIKDLGDRVTSSASFKAIRDMDKQYSSNASSLESGSDEAIRAAISTRLNLIGKLTGEILRNANMLAYYHDRYSKIVIQIYTAISLKLAGK